MTQQAKLLLVRLDVVDRLLNRGDLLGIFIRNFAFEFLFECHHEFNRIQRICAQIIYERRFILDVSFVNAELFGYDLLTRCSMLSIEAPITLLFEVVEKSGSILPNHSQPQSFRER